MKEKKLTIKEVAKIAECSVSAISAAFSNSPNISDKNRQRILSIANNLGYKPDLRASLLRQNKTRQIGIVYNPEQIFHGILINDLNSIAMTLGYNIITIPILKKKK